MLRDAAALMNVASDRAKCEEVIAVLHIGDETIGSFLNSPLETIRNFELLLYRSSLQPIAFYMFYCFCKVSQKNSLANAPQKSKPNPTGLTADNLTELVIGLIHELSVTFKLRSGPFDPGLVCYFMSFFFFFLNTVFPPPSLSQGRLLTLIFSTEAKWTRR